MSNSKLATYTKLSPNCNAPRNHKIDKITIHHMAGNGSVETCGEYFSNVAIRASANYGIGSDGRIGLYVDEVNRAWTSSSPSNDHRAVTIEVANDGGAPNWHVSDKALAATIDLCVDICRRNGIKALNFTGDATGNLTMHKWFTNTLCPGPYLSGKFQYIADQVNARLGSVEQPKQEQTSKPQTTVPVTAPWRVQVGAFSQKAPAERKLKALESAGFTNGFLAVVDSKLWRVQLGAYTEKAAAEQLQAELQAAGFSSFVTQLSGTAVTPEPATNTTQVKKSNDRIAQEVVWGQWGNGAERKKKLTAAGYDYDTIQAKVNVLMGKK
jgi:hypothetical protein